MSLKNDIVVIHQPDFLPYLGFFHRLLYVDKFIVFDNVQFVRRGWHNRDKIKTANGEKWITVSVQKAPINTPINEVLINDHENWRANSINLIKTNYKNSLFFDEVFPYIEELYNFDCLKLVDFNWKSITILLDLFEIKVEVLWASALNPRGKNNDLIIDLVKKADCSRYLSGVGARDYFEPSVYDSAGVEVIWQKFQHPEYAQLHGRFIPFLSSIDMLFNCGIEKSRKILHGLENS